MKKYLMSNRISFLLWTMVILVILFFGYFTLTANKTGVKDTVKKTQIRNVTPYPTSAVKKATKVTTSASAVNVEEPLKKL